MSASKRGARALSDDADAPNSKMSKTTDTAEADFSALFKVQVKVPSASKAARNDYCPPTSAQRKMQSILTSTSASPLTKKEQQVMLCGSRSDPAEQSGHAADPQANHAEERCVLLSRVSTLTLLSNVHLFFRSNNGEHSSQQIDNTMSTMLSISDDEDDSDAIMGHESEESTCDEDEDSNFDQYEEFEWFEAIDGSIHLKQANDAAEEEPSGFCTSALIRRNHIRAVFYHQIEEPTEESSAMGFALFDRYGRLKTKFKEHGSDPGSGIWGDELDTGDIHLIDQVRINNDLRHKGLGKMLLEAVLDRGIAKSNSRTYTAIARIAVMTSDIRDQLEGKTEEQKRAICNEQEHISQCFLRASGFRRIGSTEWFARAGDKQHRCYGLPAGQDFDPPSTSPSDQSEIMNNLIRDLDTLETDDARLDAAQKALGGYAPDDSAWTSTDAEGNTLLHHLANSESPACVKWALSKCPKLADIRNFGGNTPLESLEERLESKRTQKTWMALTVPVSDKFSGHSEAAVETLVALKGLIDLTPQDLARFKYGCTCRQCQFGFLSPRMHFAVLTCAELEHDQLSADAHDGNVFVETNDDIFDYLPEHVRDNLRTNKSMRQGFANLFHYFAECLNQNELPAAPVILYISRRASEWPPVTRHYLDRGGTVDAVGSALFQKAMKWSLWAGDGITEDFFGEEISKLPACRNDDEFGFVSGMCGYRRVCQMRYVSLDGELMDDQT